MPDTTEPRQVVEGCNCGVDGYRLPDDSTCPCVCHLEVSGDDKRYPSDDDKQPAKPIPVDETRRERWARDKRWARGDYSHEEIEAPAPAAPLALEAALAIHRSDLLAGAYRDDGLLPAGQEAGFRAGWAAARAPSPDSSGG